MPLFDDIKSQLNARRPLPPLFPTQVWQPELSQQVLRAGDNELFGPDASGTNLHACRAGLLLWNDDLEESHRIAQGIEDATGSFWHAIMHRREGDPSNSGHWWHNTGDHPAFADVYTEAMSVLINESDEQAREFAATLQGAGTWAPLEFVKCCEKKRRGEIQGDWVERVQVAEMAALLDWCRR
jgi:hypothetical protein